MITQNDLLSFPAAERTQESAHSNIRTLNYGQVKGGTQAVAI